MRVPYLGNPHLGLRAPGLGSELTAGVLDGRACFLNGGGYIGFRVGFRV